jgi:hypothetical protein
MIIDIAAFAAGLYLPLALALSLFGGWYSSLRFYWDDYIEGAGGHDPSRRYWMQSFVWGAITSVAAIVVGYVRLHHRSFGLFAFAVLLGVALSALVVFKLLRIRRIRRELECLESESLVLTAKVIGKVDEDIDAGVIRIDPKWEASVGEMDSVHRRMEELRAKLADQPKP